jgi:crossover junction endodeoxyribonuclease RuvC
MTSILGIDPGSRIMGYGIVIANHDQIKHLTHGVVNVSATKSFSERIALIGKALRQLIESHQPQMVVVEKIFLGKNADSAFKLGHARGVVLYEAELAQLRIREYSTRLVKKGISGRGEASKEEVQIALQRLLRISLQEAKIDASDALALAYYHAVQLEYERKLEKMGIGLS